RSQRPRLPDHGSGPQERDEGRGPYPQQKLPHQNPSSSMRSVVPRFRQSDGVCGGRPAASSSRWSRAHEVVERRSIQKKGDRRVCRNSGPPPVPLPLYRDLTSTDWITPSPLSTRWPPPPASLSARRGSSGNPPRRGG